MAEQEQYRTFETTLDDGKKVWLSVRRPERSEIEHADLELSATFNRSLLAGLPPRTTMIRKLRDKGLWSDADDTRIRKVRDEGVQLEEAIDKDEFKSKKEKDKALGRRTVLLRTLNEMRAELDQMLGHTADAKADQAQLEFLIACTTEYAEVDDKDNEVNDKDAGERVWQSPDDYRDEQDGSLTQRVFYEYMMFTNRLPSVYEQFISGGEATDDEKEDPTTKPEASERGDQPTPPSETPVAEKPATPAVTETGQIHGKAKKKPSTGDPEPATMVSVPPGKPEATVQASS